MSQTESPSRGPGGFVIGPPAPDDAQAIADLMRARDVANYGEPDSDIHDVLSDWSTPQVDPQRDAWVMRGPHQNLIGYAILRVREPDRLFDGDVYVGAGESHAEVGRVLLQRLEGRVRERIADATHAGSEGAVLAVVSPSVEEGKRDLALSNGYAYARTFFRMKIDLPPAFQCPPPPEGLAIRSLRLGADDRAFHQVLEDSFSEHFGFARRTFEDWWNLHTGHSRFDPGLCLLARRQDEVVGALLAMDFGNMGFVREVGVLKPWRRQGIAGALLLRSFEEFGRRGQPCVMLGVDAENPSAVGLYERLGMQVDQRHDLYRKTLRRG